MFRLRNKSRYVTPSRASFFSVPYATRILGFITAFSRNRPSRRAPTIATNLPPGELWKEHKLRKRGRWRCGELCRRRIFHSSHMIYYSEFFKRRSLYLPIRSSLSKSYSFSFFLNPTVLKICEGANPDARIRLD